MNRRNYKRLCIFLGWYQLKKISQFEFPTTTSLCTRKSTTYFNQISWAHQIAPPWSTKKCDLWKSGQNKYWFFAYGERSIVIFGIFTHCGGKNPISETWSITTSKVVWWKIVARSILLLYNICCGWDNEVANNFRHFVQTFLWEMMVRNHLLLGRR